MPVAASLLSPPAALVSALESTSSSDRPWSIDAGTATEAESPLLGKYFETEQPGTAAAEAFPLVDNSPPLAAMATGLASPFRGERRRRKPLLLQSLLLAAATLCLSGLVYQQARLKTAAAAAATPSSQRLPLLDLQATLSQVERLAFAAELINGLLGDRSVGEMTAVLQQRRQALQQDSFLLQQPASRADGGEGDEALEETIGRFLSRLEDLRRLAHQLLSHALTPLQELAKRAETQASYIEAAAQQAEAIAKEVPGEVTAAPSELLGQLATEAEKNKLLICSLVEGARSWKAPPLSVEEAALALEGTAMQIARTRLPYIQLARDEQDARMWKRVSSDLTLIALRREGINRLARLRSAAERFAANKLSAAAAAATQEEREALDELAGLLDTALTPADLQREQNPAVLFHLAAELKAVSERAEALLERIWLSIGRQLEERGLSPQEAMYSEEPQTLQQLKQQATQQGWLASEHAGFVDKILRAELGTASLLHPQADAFRERAKQWAAKVKVNAAKAVDAAAQARQEAAVGSVAQSLRRAEEMQLKAFEDSVKTCEAALAFNAWQFLSTSAEAALGEAAAAVQNLEAQREGSGSNSAEIAAALQQQIRQAELAFRHANDLKAATEHALELRRAARQLFLLQHAYPGSQE
ncbi:hypothetical protein Efla_003269 [Eimeria flavescens]